ncbi:hypothetical protein D3C80_746790 [compost metagenome]
MVHADHEQFLQPAARVVIAVELVDLRNRLVGTVHQCQQLHVAGQYVVIALQLLANEVQGVLPETSTRSVEQYYRDQWAFAGLDQCEHFQAFVQRSEAAGAEDQGIGLLDEEQLAGEEKMEGQQLVGPVDSGVGMLFEWQGDIEAQAVIEPGTFVCSGHDAAASAGNHHQVGASQRCTQLPGKGIDGVFDWGTSGAEDSDFAAPLVLLQHAEGMVELTQCLQGDLGIPAIAVVLGHAQNGQYHVAV